MNIDKNYSYLIKTDNFDKIKNEFSDKKTYSINVENCASKEGCFEEIISSLQFPDCCGRNWDAIYDFLRDLSWLGESQIVILFRNYNNLCMGNLDDREILFDFILSSVEENNERIESKKEFAEPSVIIILEDHKNDHKNIELVEKQLGIKD